MCRCALAEQRFAFECLIFMYGVLLQVGFMDHKIIIIDTGNNYILTQTKGAYFDDMIRNVYEIIDLSVNIIETDINVPPETAEFVYQTIGRTSPYLHDTFASYDGKHVSCYGVMWSQESMPQLLKEDMAKVVEFAKLKKFWENLRSPSLKVPEPKKELIPLTFDQLLPDEHWKSMDSFKKEEILLKAKSNENEKTVYVLFNTLYNVSIFIDYLDPLALYIDSITTYLPDFQMVLKCPYNNNDNIKHLFHKVSFEGIEDVKKKVDAFKSLYDIPVKNIDQKEKQIVKHYLDWNFTVTHNVDKRMKANDLYHEIQSCMCIQYTDASCFKKRLAGYLMEFGLKRERDIDAYYYNGIERKDQDMLSLDELEKKRTQEMLGYIP